MNVQSPKSRFLPTLTEVVHADHLQRLAVARQQPEPTDAGPTLQALGAGLEAELRGQLQAMLNEQLQQIVPQLQAAIDAAVKQAVSNAIAQYQLRDA